jgi:hypothetical protein
MSPKTNAGLDPRRFQQLRAERDDLELPLLLLTARRTGPVGVGTEHATVAALGLQERSTTFAGVEVETERNGDGFNRSMAAQGAGDRRGHKRGGYYVEAVSFTTP